LTVDLRVILNAALLEGFVIGELVVPAGSTIEDLCELLDGVAPIELTVGEILGFIFSVGITGEDDIFSLIGFLLCLQDLGLIDIDIFAIFNGLVDRGLISPGAAAPLQ